MAKFTFCSLILLTGIWIILCETLVTAAVGVVASALCLFFLFKFLPASGASEIKLFRLVIYVLYLIIQIYLSGISAIKIIISGANVEIFKIKTQLNNSFLRTLLANSITLTPGTVTLNLSGDEITVLRLADKSESPLTAEQADEQIKGKLERMLLKAQK